jgi:uncharacterized membrane protein YdcZ (DUF606 family)
MEEIGFLQDFWQRIQALLAQYPAWLVLGGAGLAAVFAFMFFWKILRLGLTILLFLLLVGGILVGLSYFLDLSGAR